jgi:hypothetical protein
MEQPANTQATLTIDELSGLRERTEAISLFLLEQLKGYLETLRPLLLPAKLLGRFAGRGVKDVVGADGAFGQLKEAYKEVCGKPFSLLPDLDEGPLGLIETRLELYPWEYSHEARSEKETRTLTITAPMRWMLTYGSAYTLAQLRQILSGKGERQAERLRQFIVNALTLRLLLARYPGITELLRGLRYETRVEKCPGLGELSVVTISSCVPSFRPPDELILAATRLSGVPAFIELIDQGGVQELNDPIKRRIDEVLAGS